VVERAAMKHRRDGWIVFAVLLLLFVASAVHAAGAADVRALSPRALENLAAFTKLLGVVRYFHPSDEVEQVAWDDFTVAAIDTVERAATATELARTLRELFLPIAPSLRLDTRPVNTDAASLLPAGARPTAVVEWRHRGYGPSTIPNGPYSSTRLRTVPEDRSKDARPVGTAYTRSLGGGVWCSVPMVLWADASGTLPRPGRPLPAYPRGAWDHVPRAVRLADVALFWNVAEHFYPYFEADGGDWGAVLLTSLQRAAEDRDPESFRQTLERMVAGLRDGQARVSGHEDHYFLPLVWSWVGDSLVVRAVAEGLENPPRTGDVVRSIDGRPVARAAARARERVSGATPDYVDLMVALTLCHSSSPQVIDLEVLGSDGHTRQVRVDFGDPRRLASVPPPPPVSPEPEPGVAYVDLEQINEGDIPDLLHRLAAARSIVFDARGLPAGATFPLLAHLSDQSLDMPRLGVPVNFEPDRVNMAFDDVSKTISPEPPLLGARKVFLIGPGGQGPAEIILNTVEQAHLGERVGAPTLGTSGPLVEVELPGGYSIRFTGSRALKPDGSRNQGVGVVPTIPARRTVAGIAAGRDEVLDKALELLRNAAKK